MSEFSKIIKISVYHEPKLKGMIDVISDEYGFIYSEPIQQMQGLQHSIPHDKEWVVKRLTQYLEQITTAARGIDALLNPEN